MRGRRARRVTDRGSRPRPFFLLACVVLLVACATAPFTGRNQLLLLGETEEIKLGLQSYQQILAKAQASTSPQQNALVERVGRRIAAVTGRNDYAWEFRVIQDDKVMNAFCLPGGKVAVYSGMFRWTGDESGLAAVLGHEVAHAIARHGGERMSEQLLVQAGLEAVEAGMQRKDPRTTQIVKALLGAGAAVGILLPFSREHELEADYLGLIFMAQAGYDPYAARDFWHRAALAEGSGPDFLSTHPSHQTRLRQIEGWLPEALRHYRAARGRG